MMMSPLNNVRSKNQPFFFVLGKKSKAAARNAASCWSSWSSSSWSSSSSRGGVCGAWVDRESNVTTSPRKVVFENASHFYLSKKTRPSMSEFVRGLSQKKKKKLN